MLSPRARFVCAIAIALSAACHGHTDDCYDCGPPVFYESEPNDSAFQPDQVGPLGPGDAVLIEGHIAHFGSDVYDGFAFITSAPTDVEFALFVDDPYADLDLCVWDPELGQFVACFETGANPETGVISIAEGGKPFHLVVTSFAGSSTYGLDVRGYGLSFASAAAPLSSEAAIARPGARERWDGYAKAALEDVNEDEGQPAPILARLIEVDLESGEVRSRAVEVAAFDLE